MNHDARAALLAVLTTCAPPALVAFAPRVDGALVLLAWLAVAAPATGAVLAIRPAAPDRFALLPPLAWAVALAIAGALTHAADGGGALRLVPAVLALAALYASGYALGLILPAAATPPVLALVTLALAASAFAPSSVFGTRPAPRLSARALDLSPLSFVVESAGIDWQRHPLVYERAAGADIGPEVRAPWAGPLAPAVALVVGCTLAAWGAQRRRGSGTRTAP